MISSAGISRGSNGRKLAEYSLGLMCLRCPIRFVYFFWIHLRGSRVDFEATSSSVFGDGHDLGRGEGCGQSAQNDTEGEIQKKKLRGHGPSSDQVGQLLQKRQTCYGVGCRTASLEEFASQSASRDRTETLWGLLTGNERCLSVS